MSRQPRKCLRRCSGCGELRVTRMTNHKVKSGGVRRQCGIYRVADRPRNIFRLRSSEEE